MRFDSTITLGVLVHLVVLVGTIVWRTAIIRSEIREEVHRLHNENLIRLQVITSKVEDMWTWFLASRGSSNGDVVEHDDRGR